MEFSGISRAQLVKELREELEVLTACVANCVASVRWHFEGELRHVRAFIAYLVGSVANVAQTGKESQTRCTFHKAIRRTFAIAKDRGLDVKDETGMRAAFGRALGRQIESRDELTGGDWQAVGDMMKAGALSW